MPKIKVKAKAFNGVEIYPEVEVFINFNGKDNFLPDFVYDSLKEKMKQKLNRQDIDFEIISKDLKVLISKNVEIIWDDFIDKVLDTVEDIKEIKNSLLLKAMNFYKEGKIKESKEVFEKIDKNSLSSFEKDEYRLLSFMLKDKTEEDFYKEVEYFKNNPLVLKQLYFHMIKYTQDKRDEKLPKQLLSTFEKYFIIDELNNEEKSIYFYLKGRAFYYRGEFIEAIRFLTKAKKYATDEELLGNIYNTSANIFTDNFYFDEAIELANKALEIRNNLHLEEKINDTLSLIGGIYLKQNKLNKAYDYFKKVTREDARINNYRAKVDILRGFYNKAMEYIQKSKELDKEDEKGFRRSIEFLYLFKKGEIKKLKEFFNSEIVLLEKNSKIDAIVWGNIYSIMSEVAIQENYKDSFLYLYKAIKALIDDNYILEASYLSLYPYKWNLNKNLIDEFNQLVYSLKLNSKISEYVYRHSEILNKEANEFGIEVIHKNLIEFYSDFINQNIFNKYNLF